MCFYRVHDVVAWASSYYRRPFRSDLFGKTTFPGSSVGSGHCMLPARGRFQARRKRSLRSISRGSEVKGIPRCPLSSRMRPDRHDPDQPNRSTARRRPQRVQHRPSDRRHRPYRQRDRTARDAFVAAEVFGRRGFRMCIADPHRDNRRSIRTFEKAGFTLRRRFQQDNQVFVLLTRCRSERNPSCRFTGAIDQANTHGFHMSRAVAPLIAGRPPSSGRQAAWPANISPCFAGRPATVGSMPAISSAGTFANSFGSIL